MSYCLVIVKPWIHADTVKYKTRLPENTTDMGIVGQSGHNIRADGNNNLGYPQAACIRINGGHQTSIQIEDIKTVGSAWYNPDSLANNLSLLAVHKVYRVSMDTVDAPMITVNKSDGRKMFFTEHEDGLYMYDTSFKDHNVTKNTLKLVPLFFKTMS
jgi:hypothetical protein